MIKLRPVIGDEQLCKNVMQVRDDFVYSGSPFDIKSFLNLRNRMISELTEASKINVKYSAGTLVDIEFYLQVLQIKHGATNPVIRNTNSMEALKQLQEAGVIDAKKAECLRRAYSCFRRTIDALRAVRGNAKDLVLPESNTPDYNYLARRLNFVSAEAFSQEIEWCRNQCRDLLEKLTNDL